MPELYLKEVEPFIGDQMTSLKSPDIGAQKVYNRRTTKRNTSLIATDALLLCLELLQVLAILQSMSLRWFWPMTWIKKANFVFFFNADVWEYIKVDCGAFVRIQGFDTPSSTVSVSFAHIVYGWAGMFGLLLVIWTAIKLFLHFRQPTYLLMHNARLERAYIIIIQILALPAGTTFFKVFHCSADGKMSVDNDLTCWAGLHWLYVVAAVVVAAVIFVAFPAYLIWRIRHEALAASHQHHEDFLKLKEVEYMSGLDVVWAVRGFHIFSSFRLHAIYFRPATHLTKLLILIIYAATFRVLLAQAVCVGVILFLAAIFGMAVRPYRIMAFNIMFVFGCFCLVGDAVFGGMLTQYSAVEVESPWLVEPYSLWIMVTINGLFLFGGILTFLIFLLAYRLCCQGRCVLEPLWPVMPAYEYEVEGVETEKYLAAVLRGRALIEHCRRLPVIFVPVHELAHQIHILNAYMRESELMEEGLHPTLWAVLDEMIDMHQRLEPKSLFSEMVHESIRKNAAHFMTLMPMFAQRLAQRDYDLILVSPLKKRLLLKMYIIALWWDGSRKRKTHQQLTQQVLARIWEESPDIVAVTEQREYREDLYPAAIQGPDTEALYTTGTLDLGHDLYDLERVEEEEESLSTFLQRAPPILVFEEEQRPSSQASSPSHTSRPASASSNSGRDNPAFVPDENQQKQQQQTLTTTEVKDLSETPPDVLVDLEGARNEGEGQGGEDSGNEEEDDGIGREDDGIGREDHGNEGEDHGNEGESGSAGTERDGEREEGSSTRDNAALKLEGFQPGESSTDTTDDTKDDTSSASSSSKSGQHKDTRSAAPRKKSKKAKK